MITGITFFLIMSYGQIDGQTERQTDGQLDRQTDRYNAIDKVFEIKTLLCCPCLAQNFVYNLVRGGAWFCTNNLTRMTTSIKT